MIDSRQITEGALLTAIYIALLFVTVFVPFFILIGMFLLPIPFIIYASKYGWKSSSVMFFVALFISLLVATVASVPITILASLGGITIGIAMHRMMKPYDTWALGTLGFIAGFLIVLVALYLVLDINIYQELNKAIEESIAMMTNMMSQMGLDAANSEEIALFEEQMRSFVDLLPSSIAIASILFAFVSQWLSYKVLNRMEQKDYAFPPFRKFNLPVAVLWIYFFALILSFIDLEGESELQLVLVNTLALTTVLILIQGFSFIFFYADLKNIHISIPIIIVIVTLLLPFLFMFIVRIIGIIDLGFSLKKRLTDKAS